MSTLVELLQSYVERFGPSPALLIKPALRYRVWTYDDMWRDAGKVASFLQDRGILKGDKVLLWGPNTPYWVLAFFGILRAGAIGVPLDVRSAKDFVGRVVDSTEPKLAFVSRFTAERADLDIEEVSLEDLEVTIAEYSSEPAKVAVEPGDLAEIMFTSGTTGDPKGVMLSHGNIASNVEAVRRVSPAHSADRMLSILPLSHMFEQTGGLLVPLSSGCRIAYPTSRQPTFIFKALREMSITILLLVPQGLQLFMDGIEREVERKKKGGIWRALNRVAPFLPIFARRLLFANVHKQMGGKLKFALSGGARLEPALARKWENLGVRVLEGYGTTEASPVISFNSLDRQVPGSVGKVLSGQEVRIATDGEVLVKGPNVTSGYWRNEESTKSLFDGDWYKTGDLGHLDDDGFLFLRGRKKDLIVLANGQNVYAEDIESMLTSHPAVKEGVVLGIQEARSGGERVHAVLLMEDPSVPVKDVVDSVNAGLADHQRIADYTVWSDDDFPRTHTLKVKKGIVLDAIVAAGGGGKAEALQPADAPPSETVDPLLRLVAEVAEVPVRSVESGSTLGGDLGIDSLKRVELLSYVEQQFGTYVDESQVDPTTTVQELVELVASQAQVRGGGLRFYGWPLTAWCRALRRLIHLVLIFPYMSSLYKTTVSGVENLDGLQGPVVFAINHNAIQWDSLIVLKSLPKVWRRRVAYAAAAEITFSKLWLTVLASLVGGAFPFDRETAIRQSMEYLGGLLDSGWNVGIFPEGEQLLRQPMLPFKSGVGLLGVECRAPIVPIRIVTESGPSARFKPLFGNREVVSVYIGRPLELPPDTSYPDAANQIEQAVRSLA